jgi:cyclic pyranopterin phosphate synthase
MLDSRMVAALSDARGRPLRSLRISVTDRCNLRCRYCMPAASYRWLPHADILGFEEIARLARLFAGEGARKVRLTGGEPLLRRGLPDLVRLLSVIPGVEELALTTNGIRLAEEASPLRAAGLQRVTVSLDTLRPEVFRALCRDDRLEAVLEGLEAAAAAGFEGTKLDTVVLRGVNDGEILDLLDFAAARGLELRFIEYMDVAGAREWRREEVVPMAEILACIAARRGRPERIAEGDPSAPATRFRCLDGQIFGVIPSVSAPFCDTCDRGRLTADGRWILCLYAAGGIDFRALLRGGAGDGRIREAIREAWRVRRDRGAWDRLQLADRGPLADPGTLWADPHLEMHTRGG